MSTRKQRAILRERRMEFDRKVEESRKAKAEMEEGTPAPSKRGRPKKKVD